MTTETIDSGPGAFALSVAEEAFFSSGGESTIPDDDAGGGTGGTDSGSDAGNSGEVKQPDNKAPQAPQHVPLAALHEERGKRKNLEKETRELREKLANFEGRFAVLDRLAPKDGVKAPDAPAAPPSVEDDIFGAVKHVGESVAQMQKRLDDEKAQREESAKVANEHQTFVTNYRDDATAFEAKTPDYKPAYNHLLASRAQELIAIGFDDPKALIAAGADPADIHAAAKALHDALVADEFAIADRAFKAKKSPAEIIYNLAKQRGYKAAAPDGKKPGEEKLEQIERGQQTNKSLNATGGDSGDADMTAERLIAMPMDEYEAWVAKNPAKARRIMGG